MAREVLVNIGKPHDIAFVSVPNRDEFDRLRKFQQGHGIGKGSGRGATAIPAHQRAIELETVFLDIWHDDDRAAGFEQSRFDNSIFGPPRFGFSLGDYCNVEGPCESAERAWHVLKTGFNR